MCRSVPQMEATFTFTKTSVRPNPGTFTSRTSAPGAASGLTTASMVPAIIGTYQLDAKTAEKHKTYDSRPPRSKSAKTKAAPDCIVSALLRFERLRVEHRIPRRCTDSRL